jgi:antitoxin (DNA-binding transcriptional repressor) of toxin-antitoxin stability system
MQTVSLDMAQKQLADLVHGLPDGGELVITEADRPVARLTPVKSGTTSLRDLKPRSVGMILRPYPAPDDDILGEMLDARP